MALVSLLICRSLCPRGHWALARGVIRGEDDAAGAK